MALQTHISEDSTPSACEDNASTVWVAKAQAILKSPWLALVLTAGLIWALLQVAPLSEWKDVLARANPLWLAVAVGLSLPHAVLKLLRMEVLLPVLKPHRGAHLNTVFGTAVTSQLPVGTVGGDVYRIVCFTDMGVEAEDATAATLLVRLSGFAVTVIIAGVAAAIYLGEAWPVLGVAVGTLILFILARSQRPPKVLRRLADMNPDGRGIVHKVKCTVAGVLKTLFDHAGDLTRRRLAALIGITLAMYAARAAILWTCLLAIGMEAGPFAALAALAVGNLASSVPSPTGSVGLREGGMVGVLAGLGHAAAPAAIAAILFRAAVIAGSGLGYLLTLPLRGRQAHTATAQ